MPPDLGPTTSATNPALGTRILGILGFLFFAFVALANAAQIGAVSIPVAFEPLRVGIRVESRTVVRADNGLHAALGSVALCLALFCLNGATRGARGGWIDRLLGRERAASLVLGAILFAGAAGIALEQGHPTIGLVWVGFGLLQFLESFREGYGLRSVPLAGMALAFIAVFCTVLDVRWHADPAAAAEAFRAQDAALTTVGDTVFGVGEDGVTRFAPLTADLVRALRDRGLTVGLDSWNDHQCTPPGWSPVVLGALVLAAVWRGRRRLAPSRWAACFGAVNLYVLLWFAMAQTPYLWPTFDGIVMNPIVAVPMAATAALGLVTGFLFDSKLRGKRAAEGWVSLFFTFQIVPVVGIYLATHKTEGNPSFYWLLCYLLVSFVAWHGALDAARVEKEAA